MPSPDYLKYEAVPDDGGDALRGIVRRGDVITGLRPGVRYKIWFAVPVIEQEEGGDAY